MFGNLGLHIIKNPAGTFSYVGSIPRALCETVAATTADIMAGRSFQENGKSMTSKRPVFATREEAVSFASLRGFAVAA